tara:strand:+ start:7568 stop:8962 length:1395 start_codon:yes stop_codon:yes gene_type:complete
MAKIIKQFNLDTSNISAAGEVRGFSISGDNNAGFYLSVKNEDNNYYNFVTQKFQANETFLKGSASTSGYTGIIVFPPVTDADQYEVYLVTDPSLDSEHADYIEVKDEAGDIDVNASTGSTSNFLRKRIVQTLTQSALFTVVDTSSNAGFTSMAGEFEPGILQGTIGKPIPKTSFTLTLTANATTSAFRIDRQPQADDFVTSITGRTIGNIKATGFAGETTNNRFGFSIDNADGIEAGMVVTGSNVTANTVVTEGREFSIESEGTDFEKSILKLAKKAVKRIGKITLTIDEVTKLVTRSFEGIINFNVGQADALEGDTDVSFFAFGPQKIKQMTGWDIKVSNLKAELTPITAVTNAATSSANNLELVVARGIMVDHTTVSSINLTERVVTGLTSYNEASNGHSRGTVGFTGTASLESGEVVNINGSGQTVTVTGDIEVIECGSKVEETTISIDVSRFITAVVTTS